MLPTPTRTFVRPLERNGDAVGSRDELPVNPLRKCQDNELLMCAGPRGRGWSGMPAGGVPGRRRGRGWALPRPCGRARHARLLEAPEGENNEHAGVQEIRRKLGFFFYTTHLGYLASLDRRVCRGPCFSNRTGPAVGPLKDRIRTSTGLVHLKDRPCNRTGKNRLNRPVSCKTGEPGGFLWIGAVF